MKVQQLFEVSIYAQASEALRKAARAAEERLRLPRLSIRYSHTIPAHESEPVYIIQFVIPLTTRKKWDNKDLLKSMGQRAIEAELRKLPLKWKSSSEPYEGDFGGSDSIFFDYDVEKDIPEEWYKKAGLKKP